VNEKQHRAPATENPPGGIRAIELVVLGTCVLVLIAGSAAVGVLIWPQLNPKSWTASGWAASGAWFSGVVTATSVWFAVKMSREAQSSAMRSLGIQLAEDSRREQLGAVGNVWSSLRAQNELVNEITDRWYDYAQADAAANTNSLNPDSDAPDDSVSAMRAEKLVEFHAVQKNALKLAASVKDIFLEAMWTVSDPQVRADLDKLHKSYRQLSTWIERTYMNFPNFHPILDSSTGEILTPVAITESIQRNSHQLVVSAQQRLGRSSQT